MDFFALAIAAYLVAIGVTVDTSNVMSALFFKVLTVVWGIGLGFKALTNLGVL